MVKKAKTKSEIEKKSKKSKSQICKKERQILDKLQQVTLSYIMDNDSNDLDRTVLLSERKAYERTQVSARNNLRLIEKNSNSFGKNDAYDNYTCYRCKHFIKIPRNLSLPFCKTIPAFIERCEVELNFIQAIVWLKSAAASVSQISVEQLRRIFNRHCNAYDDTLNSSAVSNRSYDITPQETIQLDINAEGIQKKIFNFESDNSRLLVNESLTPERCTMKKKRRNSLSKFCIISETDEEYSSSLSDMFQSPSVFNDMFENQNKCFQLEKDTKLLAYPKSKSHIDQMNNGIVDENNIYFNEERYVDVLNTYKSVSLVKNRSVKSSTLVLDCSKESLMSTHPCNLTDEFSLMSSCNSNNFVVPQADAISQISKISDMTVCQESADFSGISQIDQISIFSNTYDESNEFQINNDCNAWINNITMENPKNNSAYGTSNIGINRKIIATRIDDECKSKTNTGYHLNLQSCKRKIITHKNIINSPSIIRQTRTYKKQFPFSLPEEYELRHTQNLSKKKRVHKREETISANWLNFTLESLNVEHIIVESLKVILSVLCDEKTANDYVLRRCWKNTLEEEAVNAALNVSDILVMEKKPNICAKEITMTIIKSLHEIITCVRLNQTSMWIYRVQIIFELCNSLSICVGIIDHLIMKLESFQSTLININKIRQNIHVMINHMHLLFYMLNITIQKYCIIIPRDRETRFMKNAISHVADLWKKNYIDDEFEHMNLHLDIMEKRWLNVLENFTAVSAKYFVQFAEKSLSLFHMLASQ